MRTLLLWLQGVVAALIGGAANAIAVIVVDPEHFNFAEGLPMLGKVAAIGAALAVAAYLKRSPLPGVRAELTPAVGVPRARGVPRAGGAP